MWFSESALNLGYEVDYIGLVSETSNDYKRDSLYFSKKIKIFHKVVFYQINLEIKFKILFQF